MFQADDRIIVALDVDSLEKMKELVARLGDNVSYCKVGMELFYSAGTGTVEFLRSQNKKVFLDLKFHDIPNTVAASVATLTRLGASVLSLHAAGGRSMLQAADWPWMLADLDGLIEDPQRGPGVFEVKTASAFKQDEWTEDRCPDTYMLQLAHYMAVTGLSYAVICVLIGGNKLQWVTVDRDEELIASLVELEHRFWNHVLTQSPPPVDGSTACAEMLSRKYPSSSNPAPLILPVEADSWIQDYLQAKREEEDAAERKRLAENRIKEVMKEHDRSTSPCGRQVTWKTVQSSRIDSAKLKKEEPALYEKFATTSATRRFSVSEGK